MRLYSVLTLVLCLGTTPLQAEGQTATESSIHELLALTNSRQLIDDMWGQVDAVMQDAMQQALAGKVPTAKQQEALDGLRTQVIALMQSEMSWERMEPLMIDMYRQTFTEEEVAGMLQFYRSPAGKAVIEKMPLVMQRSMVMMQEVMKTMVPRLQQIQAEFTEKLKSLPSS